MNSLLVADTLCLPLRGSVRRIRDSGRELAAVDPETLGMIWPYWPDPSKAGQACLQYPLSAGMMSTLRRGVCHGGDLTEVDRSP
jgi:hypothetical protein